MGVMAVQTGGGGVGVLAAGTLNVTGSAEAFGLDGESAAGGHGAGRAGRGVAHDAALGTGQLGAQGAVHVLHGCQRLVAAAGQATGAQGGTGQDRGEAQGKKQAEKRGGIFHKDMALFAGGPATRVWWRGWVVAS